MQPLFSALRTWLRTLRSSDAQSVSGSAASGIHIPTLCRLTGHSGNCLPDVPQLDMAPVPLACQRDRARVQRSGCQASVGDDATVVHEGQRHRECAEQPASKLHQRKRADDARAVLRHQIEAVVAEGTRKDVAPGPAVIGRRIRAARSRKLFHAEASSRDVDRHHWYGSATDAPCGTDSAPKDGRMDRREPQAKSFSSCRRRGSVWSRFR